MTLTVRLLSPGHAAGEAMGVLFLAAVTVGTLEVEEVVREDSALLSDVS